MEYFRIISCKSAEKIWAASRNCVLRIYRKIVQKNFWKTNEVFYHFQTLSRTFRPLVYFFEGLLKLHSTCLREHFREKNVFQSLHFPKISDNKRNFFETLSEKFQRFCQKRKLQVQRIFWDIFLYSYYSNFFRTLTASLPGFRKENLGVFVKTAFSFSKETFGWKVFFSAKISICYFRLKIEQKNFG